ncbi:hypothetical protein OPTIMUS_125 [Mycobacterium phage Optimus]|uniref:Uncharacterized protein n=1 Tax=Mycobacterium phage Optimus TaxID=2922218 RepID=G1DAR4_9CAUD|nr:hypothetical protein FDG54_gp125 [Mycobacterium phage Optimus]AEJ92181.1 hypothetical protein OPTIMUS_125 [Mycobacterium phage Optimus]
MSELGQKLIPFKYIQPPGLRRDLGRSR